MAAAVCQRSSSRSWSDHGFHLTQGPIPFNLRLSSYPSTEGTRDFGGRTDDRSFLEAILMGDRRINDEGRQPAQKHDVYAHATVVNPPSLRLSQKSLELCTENLGNETGSDISDSDSMEAACAFPTLMREEQTLKPSQGEARKAKKYGGFPPPLTTIEGKEPIQFKSRREQGRLVLEAVKMSPMNSIFQAKRSQGRLTLCFLDDSAPISGHHNVKEEEQQRENRNRENEDKVEGDEDDVVAAADRRMTETLKRLSRCRDGDHRRQIQNDNRGLLNLGDVIGPHFLNFRLLFLVALICTIC